MKISVIIPTYNRSRYLLKAIKSALAQTYPVYEILVCDDGSTDNSRELIKELDDKKVKWISEKHSGLPAIPRNRGIRRASGNWLAFLDSDDSWHKDKLEKQIAVIQQTGIGFCCTNATVVNNQFKIIRPKLINSQKKLFRFVDIIRENKIICSSVMISKKYLEKSGVFPESDAFKGLEDYALWLKVLIHHPAVFIDEGLVTYKDNPQNSVRKDGPSYKEQILTVTKYIQEEVDKAGLVAKIKLSPLIFIKRISALIHK